MTAIRRSVLSERFLVDSNAVDTRIAFIQVSEFNRGLQVSR